MSSKRVVVGIDLGTTNSCIAVCRNSNVEIIRNGDGNELTPSVVSFSDTHKVIGDAAKNEALWNLDNTVYGVKRLIGRDFKDPKIQEDMCHCAFNVVEEDGKPNIKVWYQGSFKYFHPEEISAMILQELKSFAEDHLGCEVKDAVVTVPAYFDNNQRQATRAAGRIAGLNIVRLINEPTAAAIAYGLHRKDHRNVLVYDLGGGTFDVSILTMDGGVFDVKATKGDTHLGGEDFDNRLVNHFAREIKEKHNMDVFGNKNAVRRLKNACEKAKIELSSTYRNKIRLDELPDLLPGLNFEPEITRMQFEKINEDLFKKTIEIVKEALNDCKMDVGDIDDVVLVGGSSRIPRVLALLKGLFGNNKLNRNIDPDEAVAYGAAMQGAILSDCPPVNVEGITLSDVVPLSLGTDVKGGLMSVIIPRNTKIPERRKRTYKTTMNYQREMLIQVYEGERSQVKDNILLGQTILKGISPEPRGAIAVDVIFEIDDDCILHVKARDRDTKKEENLQICNNAKKLDEEEIERLIRDAANYRNIDLMETSRIRELNSLELYMNDLKLTCSSPTIRIPDKEKVLDTLSNTSEWIESFHERRVPKEDIQSKRKELEDMWNPIIVKSLSQQNSADGSSQRNRKVIHFGD